MQRLSARQLDPRRAERDEDDGDEQPAEVDDRGAQQQRETEEGEHAVGPDSILEGRRQPSARGERSPTRACEPCGEEKQQPDDDHEPERAAHELGEDVPGVARSRSIVASGDELGHDVVPRQTGGGEPHEPDDD